MREVYEKIYRRTNFSFAQNGKEYTQRVINVTFKYSVKEYNQLVKNIYVRDGYALDEIELKDCICYRNGRLIGIQVEKPVEQPVSNDMLGKFFYYESGAYKAKKNIANILGVAELRKRLYMDGFYCDGIKYVRFKRSSGSSRVGKCLFIDEKLYDRMHKWEMCGIKVQENQEIDLAALEAYIALPLSSIIGTLEIDPENILVIKDYESTFEDDVIAVDIVDKQLRAEKRHIKVCNSIWDGQSLIDPSLMGPYSQYGFVLLRNRFFKSACFNCNIQKWFTDHNITSISQLNGFTLAKNITDIKLITTPSSIKYLKFGKLEEWLKRLDPLFGVVKHEKPTHFFDGRLVQTHYQLLNSLHMTQHQVDKLLMPSLDYVKLLESNPAVLRYHIQYPANYEFKHSAVSSKNDVIYKMLGINEKFAQTKLYQDFKYDLIRAYIKSLRQGHILVNGNYSTLVGNPIEMLESSIGTFIGISGMPIGCIYTKRFPFGITVLGSRSPHVTAGNILLATNKNSDEIAQYMNVTNEIVCVNSIGENLLNRLSGCDFDSDCLLLTDNQLLIESAIKHYNDFLVPTGLVPGKKLKRRYTAEQKADLDIKTSVNKIGEIINLSQELNTILWHKVNHGTPVSDLMDLYCDIAKLDVLSNLEIDKAKKEYEVDSVAEIKKVKLKYRLTDKDGRKIKPNFFGAVAKSKGYYDPQKKHYKFHSTTMDYLQHTINRSRHYSKTKEYISFSDMLIPFDMNFNKVNYHQISRIVSLIRSTRDDIGTTYSSLEFDSKEKIYIISEIRQECIEYIEKIKLNSHTMYWLLRLVETDRYKDIKRLLFGILFGVPNKSFFQLIIASATPVPILVEDCNGSIILFDNKYRTVVQTG